VSVWLKIIIGSVAGAGILAAALVLVFGLLGRPWDGRKLAERLGIPRPAIIAHRGASYLAPEETRPAFLLARELGASYLEFDVQRTQDGVLVALHDDDLSRTTNVREIFPGRERDTLDTFTYAELQRLDAGSWFNLRYPARARSSFQELRILRIEEILEIAESGSPQPGLYIETKAAGRFPGIERQLVELLADRGWLPSAGSPAGARLMFQSFAPESLARLKTLAPAVPRLLLVDEIMASRTSWEDLVARAAELGHGIGTWGARWAFGPHWSKETVRTRYVATWPGYTGRAHKAGLLVHCWTVDDRWEMWMVAAAGADGIFTNRPELARAVYGEGTPDLAGLWQRIGYQ
jgi:glycerophosphoryl diester phosphodiesterase